MKHYTKDMGRILVNYQEARGEYNAVELCIRDGWNETCQFNRNLLSVEEVRDLRYLLCRVIAHATDHPVSEEGS